MPFISQILDFWAAMNLTVRLLLVLAMALWYINFVHIMKKTQKILKKMQKGRIRGTEINRRISKANSYAIKSLEHGRVTEFQIEAARKAVKRIIKKKGELVIRVKPYHTLTKKSAGVRMGKGKGRVDSVVYPIKPGKIILELRDNMLIMPMALKILRQATYKFSVAVSVVKLKD